MDRIIQRLAALDGDLIVSEGHGFAYQHDMSKSVPYDDAYFDKYVGYEGKDVARKINAGRVALVNKYVGAERVLDIGIGSGEFIKHRPNTRGFDVNPKAITWLKDNGLWSEDFDDFKGFTFWDVLEHVREPNEYFRLMPAGAHLFTSIPVFKDLTRIRESRHYRPNEHYYYFTVQGFIDWMALHRFYIAEHQDFETRAGRENIMSFAFLRA